MKKLIALLTLALFIGVSTSPAGNKAKTTSKMACCAQDAKMTSTTSKEECKDDAKGDCCKNKKMSSATTKVKAKKLANVDTKVKATEKKEAK